MTASLAIEGVVQAGVLGAASVLGVSKLYDLEKHATKWPDSFIAFGLLLGWLGTAIFTLATCLMAMRGVEVPGTKWVLLTVIALTFATHWMKRCGLLKTTVLDDYQERDPQPAVHAVARAGPHYADNRP